jgi:chromosome segregation and condensation protein ScpB
LQRTKEQPASANAEAKQGQDAEKTQSCLRLLEAALYVAGRPLNLNELCSVLNTRSKKKTKKYTKTLMQEYSARNTALEILELKDERYVLQLKACQ